MERMIPLDGEWTLESLVELCVSFEPDVAARRNDSTLCVTPLIEVIWIDGVRHELKLVDGRWAAGVVRVSSPIQRSERAPRRKRRKAPVNGRSRVDGYNEEEQIVRAIRHFVHTGQAYKLYSDAGVTGEFPNNDELLIKRLLNKKADRYKCIFERTLLDEASLARRSAEDIARLRGYLNKTVEGVRNAYLTEDELYKNQGEAASDLIMRKRRGRPRTRAFHRQAFSQLWLDIEANLVHTVAATDRSRLCRDADVEKEFLTVVERAHTRLFGLVEALAHIDVSDPLRKGLNYMLGSINEARQFETLQNSFRGTVQRLEAGRSIGKLPWWLMRGPGNVPVEKPGCAEIIGRMIDLAAMGLGDAAIHKRLRMENLLVEGKALSAAAISRTLYNDGLRGFEWYFGLPWKVYPVMVADDTRWEEVQQLRRQRTEHMLKHIGEPRTWADHTYRGLLFCWCGRALTMTYASTRAGEIRRYYSCNSDSKTLELHRRHARLTPSALDDFFGEVLSANPHLLTGELAPGLAGASAARSARRALLEETLKLATAEFCRHEEQAREKAAATARSLNIAHGSAEYSALVEATTRALLVEERQKLNRLQHERDMICAEIGADKRTARLMEAVAALRGWSNLDELTRNRLLHTLIERLTVYPPSEGGYVDIKLIGVDVHLYPLKLRAPRRNSVRLPTVDEWLSDMLGTGGVEETKRRTPRRFYDYLGVVERDATAEGELARKWRQEHKDFLAYRSSRASILGHLRASGLSAEEEELFESIWSRFSETRWL